MTGPSVRLRAAANLLRAAADAATPGPWEVLWNAVAYVDTVPDPSDPTGQTPMQEPVKVADAAERDRAYIALMDPAVGVALAAWLDHQADMATVYPTSDDTKRALAVADALGVPG